VRFRAAKGGSKICHRKEVKRRFWVKWVFAKAGGENKGWGNVLKWGGGKQTTIVANGGLAGTGVWTTKRNQGFPGMHDGHEVSVWGLLDKKCAKKKKQDCGLKGGRKKKGRVVSPHKRMREEKTPKKKRGGVGPAKEGRRS